MHTTNNIFINWRNFLLKEEAKNRKKIKAKIKNVSLTLELLTNQEEHELGFMFRKRPNQLTYGLLFLYPKLIPNLSFWMKNVQFDIDLLALDTHNNIIQIEHLYANNENPVYIKFPCNKVLEMPTGFCKKYKIHTGDAVNFFF